MPEPRIVLHQWLISPFCAKVRLALAAKGLAYETEEYNGLLAAKAKRLTRAGKLPVLDYTDASGQRTRVQDSSAIIAALERLHPEPSLYPEDPRERGLAHVIEDWADESLFWFEAYFRLLDPVASRKAAAYLGAGRPGWEGTILRRAGELTYKRRLAVLGLGSRSERELVEGAREHFEAIAGMLAGREWLVGDRLSIADIAVAAQVGEFVRTSRFADELEGHADIGPWLTRVGVELKS